MGTQQRCCGSHFETIPGGGRPAGWRRWRHAGSPGPPPCGPSPRGPAPAARASLSHPGRRATFEGGGGGGVWAGWKTAASPRGRGPQVSWSWAQPNPEQPNPNKTPNYAKCQLMTQKDNPFANHFRPISAHFGNSEAHRFWHLSA